MGERTLQRVNLYKMYTHSIVKIDPEYEINTFQDFHSFVLFCHRHSKNTDSSFENIVYDNDTETIYTSYIMFLNAV